MATRKIANINRKTKGTGQKGRPKGGALPNPFTGEFQKLSLTEQMQAYRDIRTRVNQQFRQQEKRGIAEFLQSYVNVKESGEVTAKGNVGFASKFRLSMLKTTKKNPVPMTESEFKKQLAKEYKRIYSIQTGKSLYAKKSEIADMLAQKGIDIDELSEEDAKEELKDYWNLYDELKKAGVFEAFDLKSDEAQDIVSQYRATNPFNTYYANYPQMAKDIAKSMEEAKSINNPDDLPDATIYDYFFDTKNISKYIEDPIISKIDAETRRLAQILAKQNYGTRPVKPSFKDGLGSIARHFAKKK